MVMMLILNHLYCEDNLLISVGVLDETDDHPNKAGINFQTFHLRTLFMISESCLFYFLFLLVFTLKCRKHQIYLLFTALEHEPRI